MTDPLDAVTGSDAGATRSLLPADDRSARPSGDGALSTSDPTIDSSDALSDAGPPILPPGYEMLEEVGSGGMGVVYRARELSLNRHVAVKILHGRFRADSPAAARFTEEAQITGQLQHPGIPPVHQVGTLADGRPFLVMKLIKGNTLEELLRARADPAADRGRFLAVFEQVCQAVACAHDRKVIHRDLKPANLMVGSFGEVQVMDWGLAKPLASVEASARRGAETDPPTAATVIRTLRDSEGSFTQAGSVLGTPAFMPPEQAGGEVGRIDERADVFGLGAILCVILTGKPPFVAADSEAVRLMAIRGQLDECLTRLDGCGAEPELVALAKRCLSAEPADRPRNAGEVAAAVAGLRAAADERARQAELEKVRAEGELRAAEVRAAEQRKRRKVQAALGLAFTALVVLGGAFAWWQDRQAGERKADQARVDGERAVERAAVESRARQAVESATALAAELRDKFRFAEAALALDQAAALVPPDAPADIRDRLGRSRTENALAWDLDEVRFSRVRSEPGRDVKGIDQRYRAAFAARGLDPAGGDPAAVATWVSASPIRTWVLAALDNWAHYTHDTATRDRLLDVLRRADPGPLQDALRDPRVWSDAPALDRLRDRFDVVSAPPHLLTFYMDLWQSGPGGPALVRAAAMRHLTDFWVQFEAGWYFLFKASVPAQAVAPLRAALALRPDSLYITHMLAMALRNMGDDEGALECVRETLRRDPAYAPAHINRALLLFNKKDLIGATTSIEEAIRLGPDYSEAYRIKGWILSAKNDLDGAVEAHRRALRLRPDSRDYIGDLASALQKTGVRDSYLTACREAVRLAPASSLTQYYLGRALAMKQDFTGAVAAYREAIRLDPKYAEGHNGLAFLLAAGPDGVRDGKLAVEHATTACELTGWKEPRYMGVMAAACAEVGDFEKAVEYQKKALTFPGYEKTYGAQMRKRLELYTHRKPYRDPAFIRRELAPPPREVK